MPPGHRPEFLSRRDSALSSEWIVTSVPWKQTCQVNLIQFLRAGGSFERNFGHLLDKSH